MGKYETLNIKPGTKVTISRLAKKHDKSLVDFVEDMAIYFDKTGVNPNDMTILSPAEELKKFRDTIISFMRKQEKDFILPVFSRVDTLAAKMINYIENDAPRKSDSSASSSLKTSSIKELLPGQINVASASGEAESSTEIGDYKKLKEEYDTAKLKLDTLTKYFKGVLDNVEYKSTGLSKFPVINLEMADINGYKDYVKRL